MNIYQQEFEQGYNQLNEEQRLAVDTIDGPMMVLAGPGSGKTQLLALRVANILKLTDTDPGSILCLTFTDTAAANMRQRIKRYVGSEGARVDVHTYHSFGGMMIADNPDKFPQFVGAAAIDPLEQNLLIARLIEKLPLDAKLKASYGDINPSGSQGDVSSGIDTLKKEGVNPSEYRKILANATELVERVGDTFVSVPRANSAGYTDYFHEIAAWLESLNLATSSELPQGIPPLNIFYQNELAEILSESEPKKSLQNWSKKNLKKVDGVKTLAIADKLRQWQDLAEVYEWYQQELARLHKYDFSDMLLAAQDGLESDEDLRGDYQERYLYVLADEFQDSSSAQISIIHNLLDSPVHEGRPNVMVVGDDDQSIYKFQGASAGSLLQFRDNYRDTLSVYLKTNYRSGANIIESAKSVIEDNDDRIVANKEQNAYGSESGQVQAVTLDTVDQEAEWVGSSIAEYLQKGGKGEDVAVIAKTNRELEKIEEILKTKGVSYNFEKGVDVLKTKVVTDLINLIYTIYYLSLGKLREVDNLLYQTLQGEYWELDRSQFYKLALDARLKSQQDGQRSLWLDIAKNDDELKPIIDWLIDVSSDAQNVGATLVLDKILAEGSQFRSHYFGGREAGPEYVADLEAVRTFYDLFRPFESLSESLSHLEELGKYHIPIRSSYVHGAAGSVTLMSSHKSKGLEYPRVYIIGGNERNWINKRARSGLKLPRNIVSATHADTPNDHRRTLYVAMTRAESELIITAPKTSNNGRVETPIEHLDWRQGELNEEQAITSILPQLSVTQAPFERNEKDYLLPMLDGYSMSVTHLQNYIDLESGGPQCWLERNLLRFPQSMGDAPIYGNLMHEALSHYVLGRDQEYILKNFEQKVEESMIASDQKPKYIKQGGINLTKYMETHPLTQDEGIELRTEVGIKTEVEGVPINGIVDKLLIDHNERQLYVYDYKTGKGLGQGFKADSGYFGQFKSYKYQLQLDFYKILLDSKQLYPSYEVVSGTVEFVDLHKLYKDKTIDCTKSFDALEIDSLKQLIVSVYNQIRTLDLPTPEDLDQHRNDKGGYELYSVLEFTKSLL